jgi:hypothetical protein
MTTDEGLLLQLARNPPFARVAIDAHFNAIAHNRVLVEWAMDRSFRAAGPYTFTLLRGYAINDDNYVPVAETLDQPWAYDRNPIYPSQGTEIYYKVKLVDGDGEIYYSEAACLTSYWNHYDYTIGREVLRKESLLLYKRAGVRGWLFKRRGWGELCTADGCTDPDTGEVNNPECLECYGTGIVGGYYDPLEYWVIMNPTQVIKKLDADKGLLIENMETVRCLAYPSPSANDVWVQFGSNQRYVVQADIATVARHRGIDLVLNMRLEERPRSDIIYQLPTPCP